MPQISAIPSTQSSASTAASTNPDSLQSLLGHYQKENAPPNLNGKDKAELEAALKTCKGYGSGSRNLPDVVNGMALDCCAGPDGISNKEHIDAVRVLMKYGLIREKGDVAGRQGSNKVNDQLTKYCPWIQQSINGMPLDVRLLCLNALKGFQGDDLSPMTPEALGQRMCRSAYSGEKLEDVLTLVQHGIADVTKPPLPSMPLSHALLYEAAKGMASSQWNRYGQQLDPRARFAEWGRHIVKRDPSAAPIYNQTLHQNGMPMNPTFGSSAIDAQTAQKLYSEQMSRAIATQDGQRELVEKMWGHVLAGQGMRQNLIAQLRQSQLKQLSLEMDEINTAEKMIVSQIKHDDEMIKAILGF